MDPDRILDHLRPLVVVVEGAGTVAEIRGGYGSDFFGYRSEDWVGTSVFEFVAPDQIDELATYFLESAGRSSDARSLPMPFRLRIVTADGREHPVDVIPASEPTEEGDPVWIVTIVPVDLQASVSRSLEAEMTGQPRERVKELLTEELLVENQHYSTRWFLVDLTGACGPTVTTARPDDQPMADAIAHAIGHEGWRPWGKVDAGQLATIAVEELPRGPRGVAAARGWRRASVAPVHTSGTLAAAYLLFGRVPADYDVTEVNTNVLARVQRLVDATAMLIDRWHDRDRLVAAATRDPLTGLANRDAFADALADCADHAVLLYVDVDRFKAVNDRYGHDAGDRVLIEVAERIVAACRPNDVVARFGGDEFVVLLNGVDVEHATRIGQRIVDSVSAPLVRSPDIDRVTVSVGLSPVDECEDAVRAADAAMLRAKRAGRDRLIASVPR